MNSSSVRRIAARLVSWILGISVSLALVVAGCSGGGSKPTTIKVHGKVTYKGQPVSEGTITFQPTKPAAGSPNRPAVGALKPDGTYELSTFGGGDGAVPGDYAVTVRTGGDISIENPNAPQPSKTPLKYADPEKSNLKATIPSSHSGALELNFALED